MAVAGGSKRYQRNCWEVAYKLTEAVMVIIIFINYDAGSSKFKRGGKMEIL
jgi:hypothetical protein